MSDQTIDMQVCEGHPPRMYWTLRDGEDAITWRVDIRIRDYRAEHGPLWPYEGGPVSWHMHEPVPDVTHGGDEAGACDVLPGGVCYGDIGYIVGDDLLALLVAEGSDAVWAQMRSWLVECRVEQQVASR